MASKRRKAATRSKRTRLRKPELTPEECVLRYYQKNISEVSSDLIGIHIVNEHEFQLEPEQRLNRTGYSGWSIQEFSYADELAETNPSPGHHPSHRIVHPAGNLIPIVDQNGRRGCVMYVCRPHRGSISDNALDSTYMLLALYHELGHAEDYTKGHFIHFSGEMDIVGAELYAHKFCCSRIISDAERFGGSLLEEGNYCPAAIKAIQYRAYASIAMSVYLEYGLQLQLTSSSKYIRQASAAALKDPEVLQLAATAKAWKNLLQHLQASQPSST